MPAKVAFYKRQGVIAAVGSDSLLGNINYPSGHKEHVKQAEVPLNIQSYFVNRACQSVGMEKFDAA